MTKEEFIERAMNPRMKEKQCIYRVTQLSVSSYDFNELIDKIKDLECYDCECCNVSKYPELYFLTLDDARQAVMRLANKYQEEILNLRYEEEIREELETEPEEDDGKTRILGIKLEEVPIGFEEPDKPQLFYRWWLYNEYGELMDKSYCDDTVPRHDSWPSFFGRDKSTIRFNKGDIVAVNSHDGLHIGFVVGTPPRIESAWASWRHIDTHMKADYGEIIKTDKQRFFHWCWDDSDDCYTTCYGPTYYTHSHDASYEVFPLPFPLPEEVHQKLRNDYKKLCLLSDISGLLRGNNHYYRLADDEIEKYAAMAVDGWAVSDEQAVILIAKFASDAENQDLKQTAINGYYGILHKFSHKNDEDTERKERLQAIFWNNYRRADDSDTGKYMEYAEEVKLILQLYPENPKIAGILAYGIYEAMRDDEIFWDELDAEFEVYNFLEGNDTYFKLSTEEMEKYAAMAAAGENVPDEQAVQLLAQFASMTDNPVLHKAAFDSFWGISYKFSTYADEDAERKFGPKSIFDNNYSRADEMKSRGEYCDEVRQILVLHSDNPEIAGILAYGLFLEMDSDYLFWEGL